MQHMLDEIITLDIIYNPTLYGPSWLTSWVWRRVELLEMIRNNISSKLDSLTLNESTILKRLYSSSWMIHLGKITQFVRNNRLVLSGKGFNAQNY